LSYGPTCAALRAAKFEVRTVKFERWRGAARPASIFYSPLAELLEVVADGDRLASNF